MPQQENFCSIHPGDVRSNTHKIHSLVTPSAAQQLNCRLHPHEGIEGCGDRTIVCVEFKILESKGTGRCCYSVLLLPH